MGMVSKPAIGKIDKFYAKLSFVLGLGFWIPLLNYPLSIMAIIFGIHGLKLAHKFPARYGGRTFAVMGIILGTLPLMLGITVLLIPSTREIVLNNFLSAANATLAKQ
jgi:hypothetical protein